MLFSSGLELETATTCSLENLTSLSVGLSFICLYVCMLSVCPSVCLSVCLSVRPSVHPSAGLFRGLGVETAKNLVLAGPGAVTLCDDEPVSLPDLGANFFLEEGDVGKPRAR